MNENHGLPFHRTNSGPEVEAVKKCLDLGVVIPPPEVEGPRAEG